MVRVHPGPPYHGGVAQLGEHLPCKQGVSGSIPLISTIFCKLLKQFPKNAGDPVPFGTEFSNGREALPPSKLSSADCRAKEVFSFFGAQAEDTSSLKIV